MIDIEAERAKFEAWCSEAGYPLSKFPRVNGMYWPYVVESKGMAWKARAMTTTGDSATNADTAETSTSTAQNAQQTD